MTNHSLDPEGKHAMLNPIKRLLGGDAPSTDPEAQRRQLMAEIEALDAQTEAVYARLNEWKYRRAYFQAAAEVSRQLEMQVRNAICAPHRHRMNALLVQLAEAGAPPEDVAALTRRLLEEMTMRHERNAPSLDTLRREIRVALKTEFDLAAPPDIPTPRPEAKPFFMGTDELTGWPVFGLPQK